MLKLGFPLIVLGVSDINRKFWPIGFMFSSHEKKNDYFNFFMKIKTIAQKFGVNFDPHYMIIDACKAIGFAIKKCFPKCTVIMCWFHEANVNHLNTEDTSIIENKENEPPKKRGRPAKVAKALKKEPETLKIRVNKSRKTPLVAVRKSNRLINKK